QSHHQSLADGFASVSPPEEIMFEDYRAQAETFTAEGRHDDALWCYETALLDPRLDNYPTQRAALGLRLGEMQLQRLAQISDPQEIHRRLERTIALLRSCTGDLAAPHAAEIQLLLACLHCEGFERFGEQRDLL